MKHSFKVFKYGFLVLICLVVSSYLSKYLNIDYKTRPFFFTFLLVLAALLTWLANWCKSKLLFYWHFSKLKNNLEGESLRILGNQRGIPFTILGNMNGCALRYLIDLKLIRAKVYPKNLNYIYCLTDLGRLLLEKELEYKLCPSAFCEMYLLRFSEGYPGMFSWERLKFFIRNQISWRKSWDIFCDIVRKQLGSGGLQIKEETIVPLFTSYFQTKDFNTFMKEIEIPWKQRIDKERIKFFKLNWPNEQDRETGIGGDEEGAGGRGDSVKSRAMTVYVYCIKEDYKYQSSITGQKFENEWFKLSEDGTVIVKGTHYKGYAWDGCSPKFKIKDWYFGTWEAVLNFDTGQSKTYYASLIHDVFYQFARDVRSFVRRKEVDQEFLNILKRDGLRFAKLYYIFVRLFGWIWWYKR